MQCATALCHQSCSAPGLLSLALAPATTSLWTCAGTATGALEDARRMANTTPTAASAMPARTPITIPAMTPAAKPVDASDGSSAWVTCTVGGAVDGFATREEETGAKAGSDFRLVVSELLSTACMALTTSALLASSP